MIFTRRALTQIRCYSKAICDSVCFRQGNLLMSADNSRQIFRLHSILGLLELGQRRSLWPNSVREGQKGVRERAGKQILKNNGKDQIVGEMEDKNCWLIGRMIYRGDQSKGGGVDNLEKVYPLDLVMSLIMGRIDSTRSAMTKNRKHLIWLYLAWS